MNSGKFNVRNPIITFFAIPALCCLMGVFAIAEDYTALYTGETNFLVMRGENSFIQFSVGGWGPNWGWQGWKGNSTPGVGSMTVNCSSGDFKADLVYSPAKNGFSVDAALSSATSADITMIILACSFPGIQKGTWKAVNEKGETSSGNLPFERNIFGNFGKISSIEVSDESGVTTKLKLTPAISVPVDGGVLRLEFASGRVEAGKKYSFKLDVELPGSCVLYTDPTKAPGTPDFDKWFVFNGTGHPSGQSLLDMSDWSAEPAGAKGRIQMKDDKLFYGGKPIKLWGLNLCYSDCAPKKELAEKRAALYKRYGVNSVRLHKYADGSGWQGILKKDDATEFDAEGLDRMDYFISKLKDAGIFVKLSPIFYVKPRSANRADIPYYDEFEKNKEGIAQTGGGAMYLAKELQDIQIRQMKNLLTHKNPYTGMTYAEDPCIAVIEITNEDSVLFFGTLRVLQNVPTLRKRTGEAFTSWLKKKYGTKEKLLAAWGENILGNFKEEGFPQESWEDNQIYPIGNPWFYSPEQLDGSQKRRKARLLDTIEFLTSLQDETYKRMSDAIRSTGYKGVLLASNWQAGEGTSHYMNLHSDAQIGIVDRHNYFGGGGPQIINNTSMLALPGSGTLSSSFQQVNNRPFMLSEWIHVAPNEWGVEGPAVIGAYGMGLQGWDVSYMFQNRDPGAFLKALPSTRNGWDVAVPTILGSFPAVSRMVRRGDVSEARNTYLLNVHLPSMLKGEWSFRDKTRQEYDEKSFSSDVAPTEALAVSRIAVDFVKEPKPTPAFNFGAFKKNGGYVSDTGELFWSPGTKPMDGYFTIKTKGAEAIVGFAEGRTAKGDFAEITHKSRFGSIFIVARAKDKNLLNDKQILISAIARCRNSGANYLMDKIIENFGNNQNGPILMEPVKAEIKLLRKGTAQVYLLDHNGMKTDVKIPVNKGSFTIDTARDKTPYYLIEY